jgi:hypothetical protein
MLWGASSPILSYTPLEWVLGAGDVESNDLCPGAKVHATSLIARCASRKAASVCGLAAATLRVRLRSGWDLSPLENTIPSTYSVLPIQDAALREAASSHTFVSARADRLQQPIRCLFHR